eukprot:TRINITY_DN14115_c1_g1_i2.p2 TRINITY_DN14115_c1_g1~~TRINITY_DN14115_c1_g1_i2.p2  ORF type:complete len:152 (+),score=10.29 TRINITY_DN14115_c1_g1_i2:27-458(+)
MTVALVAHEKQGGGFFDVDAYKIEIAGLLSMEVKMRAAHPLLQTTDDAQVHIDVHFGYVNRTPDIHGVLGQTFRDGREKRSMDYSSLSLLLRRPFAADGPEGEGFLDGKPSDYRVSSVTASDCVYTAFDGHELPAISEANGSL